MELLPAHQIITNFFCQRKLWLETRLGMQTSNLKRDIFNEALAYTNRFEEGIVRSIKTPTPYGKIYDLYASSHRRALQEAVLNNKEELSEKGLSIIDTSKNVWKDMLLPTEMRAKNTYEFMLHNGLYGNDLWWNLIPKMTFNLKVNAPKLGISIIIDRVDSYPHSTEPVFVERGDGPEKGMWSSHRLNLGMAMLALAENKSIVQEGTLAYAAGNNQRELFMSTDLHDFIKQQILQTWKTLDGTLPEKVTNTNKCDSCPHKTKCWDDMYIAARIKELS